MLRTTTTVSLVVAFLLTIDAIAKKGDNQEYYKHIAELESSSFNHRQNYHVTNSLGYLGKYQFAKSTLLGLGFSPDQIEGFLYEPELQEEAMRRLTRQNSKILFNVYKLKPYIGRKVHGIRISKAGMLAGAHLVGPNAVRKFLQSEGKNTYKDAYNTSLSRYLKEFEESPELQIRHTWWEMYNFQFRNYEAAFRSKNERNSEIIWRPLFVWQNAKTEDIEFDFMHPTNDLSDLL